MLAPARKMLDRWLFQLKDKEAGEVQLVMRRVFILPTRPGMAFVGLLLIMLIGSVNYNLGLGFALTFFTGSCALVDMYLTAKNLALLHLAPGRAQPVFAGDEAQFELNVRNTTRRDRYAVWLGFQDEGEPRQAIDVAAGSSATLVLSRPSKERGWLAAPRVRLFTRFPLGLFGAWAYWQPDLKVLAYPQPEAAPPPLPTTGAAREDGHGTVGLDNFAGIRNYQPGDPMKHLAWRQIARLHPADGGNLVSKHFEGGAVSDLLLDLNQLPYHLDIELRLSRLTAWVLEAERRALPYALSVGHRQIAQGQGEAHCAACLRALALYGKEGA
ncbi:DUF58 domain-containing protein [Pseudoduganella sp. DS3]|uniref:DUF58 domain-containing protein n=2 Tax=Pseudoduganella guangdongensis TaxID=2692179 RepID=A0A6N9HP84_9BURK|nr:DUF58 domain-containing protein [Pseudoduganella guangdongensis]